MRFPPEVIERVREAADIVAVISEHVQLKRTGKTWKARCPFHQEKTPSFTVNPDRQIFKCFGCGEGGDVFRFLMEFDKLSFPEAVELLAVKHGIPLPRASWQPAEEQSVYPPLEWSATYYQRELAGRTGGPAREYLERRGIAREMVERFGLGWAPPGWENLLQAAGEKYSSALLLRAGLVVQNDRGGFYDRFRGRVMIPIRSALGRMVGFGARGLGSEEPKYLNSPETEVFQKGKILFALSEAKEALKERGEAVVVEGYTDVLALHQGGFRNAVASCGTAFTEDQARVLKRYVDRAVLIFDGDTAGLRAAWKSAAVFLGQGLDVRIVALPDGQDPDSFIREFGPEKLEEVCAKAPGAVGFAQEALLDRMESREDLIKTIAYLGSRMDDPIRRRVLLQEAAERFRFDEETLARESAHLRRKAQPAAGKKTSKISSHRDVLGRIYMAGLLSGEAITEEHILPEEVLREPALVSLYRQWLELYREGGNPMVSRLLTEDDTRGLVSEILASDDHEGNFFDAVSRLGERLRAVRGRALQEAIQEAESRGDRDQADQLLRELHSLKGPRV
jgi:DNA primase